MSVCLMLMNLNEKILNCVKDINENGIARNIQTFYFLTLYQY